MLQQCLPLAVLKRHTADQLELSFARQVAKVLTACGIETGRFSFINYDGSGSVATVLTACGIETYNSRKAYRLGAVATVLTACGIETPQLR